MKVVPFTNIHSHHSSEKDFITIKNISSDFESLPNEEFVSIGIHPWYINKGNYEQELSLIKISAVNKNVLAIGECGLDKLSDVDFELQKNIFISQIKIAEKVQKPLIIHCVKAFDDLIRIKKEMKVGVQMIIHGFNNNLQIAEQLIKNDFYISFGKALLNKDSNASTIISKIPTDKLFLETDDANVSIKSIFDAAAMVTNNFEDELKQKIFSNFIKVFKNE